MYIIKTAPLVNEKYNEGAVLAFFTLNHVQLQKNTQLGKNLTQ